MSTNLIRELNKLVGKVNYSAYNLNDNKILIGNPQVPISGLQYVWAKYKRPRRRLVNSMNTKGVFVSNLSLAGIVEVGILAGTASNAQIQALQLTGIPYPISAFDTKSKGTSFFLATSCQLVMTPEWRRARFPGITVYTFETPRLIVSHGLRGKED